MYQELVVSVIGASVIGDEDWLFLKHLILQKKSAFYIHLLFHSIFLSNTIYWIDNTIQLNWKSSLT